MSIVYGIADGLNFIHKQDILHYNLKSDNILLDDRLQAKLYNFRIEKDSPIFLKSASEPTDPRWTSPEKFRGEEYTKASEIYNFSLILWEIINHKTPYHDTNVDEIKTKVLIGIHPQPESTNGTPVEYQKIMEKGWDLSPKQRPNIEEMLDIFKRLEAAEKNWPHEISRIGDITHISNNFLSPNSAIKGDDASSINTNCSADLDYVSPAELTVIPPISTGVRRRFIFQKQPDYEEAIRLHNEKNYSKAWKIFKEIEKRNQTPETKFWVGYYYLKGHDKGNNKPSPKATKYLYQAAKDGHPNAQYWYAIAILNYGLIAKEQVNEENIKVANEFLRKAANQDHHLALKKLGSIIRKGDYGNIRNVAVGNEMIKRARTIVSKSAVEPIPTSPISPTSPTDKLERHSAIIVS